MAAPGVTYMFTVTQAPAWAAHEFEPRGRTRGDVLGHGHLDAGAVGRGGPAAAPRPLVGRGEVVLHDALAERALAHQHRPARRRRFQWRFAAAR